MPNRNENITTKVSFLLNNNNMPNLYPIITMMMERKKTEDSGQPGQMNILKGYPISKKFWCFEIVG